MNTTRISRLSAKGTSGRDRDILRPLPTSNSFDLALIADGGADGMHKYMLDYYSAASDYDPGYLERHNDNAGDREKIHGMFDGKTPGRSTRLVDRAQIRGL